MTATGLLDTALPLHRAGHLAEALALYRRILTDDPSNADALHLSAMIAYQTNRTAEALSGLGAALAVQPRFPPAYNSLGNVLADLGMLDESLAAYSVAIRQNDHYAEAFGNRATVLQRLGRREEAADAYTRALTLDPDNLTARFNYGILQREMGRIAPAANAFYAVVQADPSRSAAWRHLAICLRGLGHPDAEACLYRALEAAPADEELSLELGVLLNGRGGHQAACDVLAPAVEAHAGNAQLHFTFGTALQGTGRLQEAAAQFRLALDREPTMQGACNNLGVALLELGANDAASPVLRRGVALSPDDALVINNHGTSLEDRYDPEADLERPAQWYRRALRLRPDYGKALVNLAGIHIAKRQTNQAGVLYRRAAAADPMNVEVYANLAGLLFDRDDVAGAERLYRRALTINSGSPAALTGHGLTLQVLGRIDEAEAAHRRALAIDGRNAEAAGNLGMMIWQFRQDEAAAEPWMTLALSINPAMGTAHLNRGMLRLCRGDLADGWEDYRWRFRAKGYVNRRIDAPLWRGENIAGRRLLVWREQGVGDEILFASCYPSLIGLAGHAVIECDSRLVPLFARSFPQATVRAESVDAAGRETIQPPGVDAHLPAGDLPGLLRGSLPEFEPQAPWLVPDPALVERWRERLAGLGPGLRVGIGWRSQLMTADRKAAYVMLEQWGPLFALPGVVFVTLQYGDCEAELRAAEERFGVTIHRWADLNLKDDFDGAAALTANLDLVISPAMSAGELAGALGVPVWRFGTRDWTQLGTGVRPWFPTMRLFQPNPGEGLEATLSQMAKELKRMAALEPPAQHSISKADAGPGTDADRLTAEAVTLYRSGDVEAAEALVRRVLDMAPGHPVALHLGGVLAKRSGALEEAQALLVRAAAADPVNASAHAALCEVLQALDRFDAAEHASRACVAVQPDGVGHWVNRTALLRRMGHDATARSAVVRALRLRPDLATAHGHHAELATSLPDAVAAHRVAASLMPGAADILNNLGTTLHKADRFAEAERLLDRATRCDPGLAIAWTNRGNALNALGRITEAEACHRTSIHHGSSPADAHTNLAHLLARQGRHEEALAAFDAALAADPKHAQAHYNRSLLLLENGALRTGWADHEWRFATPQFQGQRRRLAMRAWRGENIAGRRLLVWREQGVGDEILFASCYDEAMRRAGRLVIECDRRLVPLFARSFPDADVRPESADPRDADVQVAAGSLPRLLRSDLKRFSGRPSWLVPDPALVERWRERLAGLGPGLRVGIGWRSQLMTADRKAAYVMLEQWGPLFALPGVVFVTLQYGDCEAELRAAEERFGVTIHRWADLNLKDDFDGAAALTANLDLVISPAMSAGELAGALGVPVWRFGTRDWTQLGTGVRPWFPTMRLFQPNPGEGLEATLVSMARALRAATSPREKGTAPVGAADVKTADGQTGEGETADPDPDPDRLLEQAVAVHRAGAVHVAAPLYERVLARRPQDPVALHLAGLLAHQSGASERGEARIAAAVAAAPDYATAHISLGNVRLALGRVGQAAASFRTALTFQPDNAAALTNLGNALDMLERSEAAVCLHRQAIAADPALAEAHDNLGAALARLGRWSEAERAHAQALRLVPGLEAGWVNLSLALRRLGRLEAAERAGRCALALAPALADGMANRGRLLRELGNDAGAGLWCGRALTMEPSHAAAAFNGGVLNLAAGRLAQGWEGYERRFDTRDLMAAARRPGVPPWDGKDLSGKRLLVWREQGIGDELMFAQRLPELIARAGQAGALIVVECDPRFVPLFARSLPQVTVRPAPASPDEPCADIDYHVALGSLSRHLGSTLSSFDGVKPVLRADPEAVEAWRRRLAGLGQGLRVGIAWRSGQLDPDRMPDYTRIEEWRPVLALPGLVPVNLQYGECGAELTAALDAFGRAPHAFADLDLRNDLDGTAALISALDLVIAPATSTGELAGGLGVPVWRLARAGDWTALGAGVRPWFPSMRLFRTGPGQRVGDLLPAVAAELSRFGWAADQNAGSQKAG
ncbi:tetratricopeptide repeat protein [Azospirillum endophyticum]